MMKKLLFGLLFLPALGFCGSLNIDSGSGTGSIIFNAPSTLGVVYPATSTASFPYGLSASTITVSSNTVLPGATFYQNGPVLLGTPGFSVTLSSNVIMPGATFYQNAMVRLGDSGISVRVSSNTILPGATFYDQGAIVSSMTVSTLTVTGASLHGAYAILSSSQGIVTASSATTSVNVWANTTQKITMGTPKNGSLSAYKITVIGTVELASAGNDGWITVFRGANGVNGGTNLGNSTGGLCAILDATITDERVPCAMIVYDMPASASAPTYTVAIRSESGGTLTWGAGNTNNVMIIEEYGSQPGAIP